MGKVIERILSLKYLSSFQKPELMALKVPRALHMILFLNNDNEAREAENSVKISSDSTYTACNLFKLMFAFDQFKN